MSESLTPVEAEYRRCLAEAEANPDITFDDVRAKLPPGYLEETAARIEAELAQMTPEERAYVDRLVERFGICFQTCRPIIPGSS